MYNLSRCPFDGVSLVFGDFDCLDLGFSLSFLLPFALACYVNSMEICASVVLFVVAKLGTNSLFVCLGESQLVNILGCSPFGPFRVTSWRFCSLSFCSLFFSVVHLCFCFTIKASQNNASSYSITLNLFLSQELM